jgi:hypothetical protein
MQSCEFIQYGVAGTMNVDPIAICMGTYVLDHRLLEKSLLQLRTQPPAYYLMNVSRTALRKNHAPYSTVDLVILMNIIVLPPITIYQVYNCRELIREAITQPVHYRIS